MNKHENTCMQCHGSLETFSQHLSYFPDGSRGGREWEYCCKECFITHLTLEERLVFNDIEGYPYKERNDYDEI